MDGKCTECGREVTEAAEEAYFFKLSPFADRIEKLLLETDYLQPKSRAVELVNNFIKPGLEDLCVSCCLCVGRRTLQLHQRPGLPE